MAGKNYNYSEITFPSSDGIHTIHAQLYTPKNTTARGIVQLAHGMIDHVGRYEMLADYLTGEGYIFAGHCHLGHGKSAGSCEDLGFFASRDGITYLLKDMHAMNRILRNTFPALPLIVMGHSMGSFIARLYIEKYPHTAKGIIIHGTSGPNPLVGMGKALARVIKLLRGERHRSRVINKLAFGSYNKRFPGEGENAWLTRDLDTVKNKGKDEFCAFKFTVSGYIDLFEMIDKCNRRVWFKEYPKEMPTLIMSGDCDPVGNYGRGVNTVYKRLLVDGAGDVTKLSYEGARHELFNETNRLDVYADMSKWLSKICK